MRHAQEIERLRAPLPPLPAVRFRVLPELEQAGLARVQLQAGLAESLLRLP